MEKFNFSELTKIVVNFFMKHFLDNLAFLYFIAYLLSGYHTYKSEIFPMDTTVISLWFITFSISALFFTIVWDGSKAFLYRKYVVTENGWYLFAWLIVMIFSVAFTMGSFTNNQNKAVNITNNSKLIYENKVSEKKQLEDSKLSYLNLVQKAIKEKEDKQKTYTSTLEYNKTQKSKYESQINTLNGKNTNLYALKKKAISYGFIDQANNYQTQINDNDVQIKALREQINGLSANNDTTVIDNNIKEWNAEIKKIDDKLNNFTFDILPEQQNTSTMIGLLKTMPYVDDNNIGSVSFIFNLIKSIMFEVVICILYSLAKASGDICDPHSPTPPDDRSKKRKKENLTGVFDSIKNLFKKEKKENIEIVQNKNSSIFCDTKDENLNKIVIENTPQKDEIVIEKLSQKNKITYDKNEFSMTKNDKNNENSKPCDRTLATVTGNLSQKKLSHGNKKLSQKTVTRKDEIVIEKLSQKNKNVIEKYKKVTDIEKQNYKKEALKIVNKTGEFPTIKQMEKVLGYKERKVRNIHEELKKDGVIETGRVGNRQKTWFSNNRKSNAI